MRASGFDKERLAAVFAILAVPAWLLRSKLIFQGYIGGIGFLLQVVVAGAARDRWDSDPKWISKTSMILGIIGNLILAGEAFGGLDPTWRWFGLLLVAAWCAGVSWSARSERPGFGTFGLVVGILQLYEVYHVWNLVVNDASFFLWPIGYVLALIPVAFLVWLVWLGVILLKPRPEFTRSLPVAPKV
jgi:hypothetical protein